MSAAIVTRVHIACDKVQGIGRCRAGRDFPAATVGDARVLAGRDGWSHRDGEDRCPVHSPKVTT